MYQIFLFKAGSETSSKPFSKETKGEVSSLLNWAGKKGFNSALLLKDQQEAKFELSDKGYTLVS